MQRRLRGTWISLVSLSRNIAKCLDTTSPILRHYLLCRKGIQESNIITLQKDMVLLTVQASMTSTCSGSIFLSPRTARWNRWARLDWEGTMTAIYRLAPTYLQSFWDHLCVYGVHRDLGVCSCWQKCCACPAATLCWSWCSSVSYWFRLPGFWFLQSGVAMERFVKGKI